jgi:hypothetical protein
MGWSGFDPRSLPRPGRLFMQRVEGTKWSERETHLYLAPSLMMHGAQPPLPSNVLMIQCLIYYRGWQLYDSRAGECVLFDTVQYFHVIKWLQIGFGLVIGLIQHVQIITTCNYNSLAGLHTIKITETTTHMKSSNVFTSRLLVTALSFVYVLKSLAHIPQLTSLLQLTNSQAGGHLTPTS